MNLQIANSWWMYLLGIIVVIFVLVGSLFFIYRAYKEAKANNMDLAIIKKVIFNSAIFTILPSISILIGVVALSGSLGVPLPWIRLTVIGALHYEGFAANTVIAAFQNLGITEITNEVFVTIAFVMTLGILTGPIYCLFGFRAYDKKVLAKARNEEVETTEKVDEETKEEKPKKKNFGQVLFDAVFIAMISAFLAVDIEKLSNIGQDGATPMTSYTPTIVIVVTFASMFVFDIIEKKFKQKWLSSFALGLSMIVGMAVAVLLGVGE
jgi:hypothetical protein